MTTWNESRTVSSCYVSYEPRDRQFREGLRRSIIKSCIYLDHMEDHLFEFVVGVESGERSVFTIFTGRGVSLNEIDGVDFNGEGNTLDMSKYKESLMNIHVGIDTGEDYSSLNHYSGS